MEFSGEIRAAGAIGGRTARACDGCGCRRARWFCAADDAFLCQACDSSVHSANRLAGRHQRVRLKAASSGMFVPCDGGDTLPRWFCRKARSPRKYKINSVKAGRLINMAVSVPDVAVEENSGEEVDESLGRVPVFDRMGFLSSDEQETYSELGVLALGDDDLPAFLSGADVDIADLDELFGGGATVLYEEEVGMTAKMELEEEGELPMSCPIVLDDVGELDFSGDITFDDLGLGPVDFRVGGKVPVEVKMHELSCHGVSGLSKTTGVEKGKLNLALSLDYKAVIAAWPDSHGSPWTTGDRPKINLDDTLPADCMVKDCVGEEGEGDKRRDERSKADEEGGGREARVSRYREKRRTRLFSKKIRYEVRKLNAEKRPRLKGRFVKRPPTSLICSN